MSGAAALPRRGVRRPGWRAGIPAAFLLGAAATPAAADGLDPAGLRAAAADRLACIESHPSREGPEPCGVAEHCADAACLWTELEGWRALLPALAAALPPDWSARLAADPAVPTYVTLAPEPDPGATLAALATACPDPSAGLDALTQCLFDAANTAAGWRDLLDWLAGRDPRRRGEMQ